MSQDGNRKELETSNAALSNIFSRQTEVRLVIVF